VKDNCLPSSSGGVTLLFVNVPTPSWKTGRFFAAGDSEEWSGRKGRQEGRGRKGRKRTGTQPKRLDPRRERGKG